MRMLTAQEIDYVSGGMDTKQGFGTIGGVVGAYYGLAIGGTLGGFFSIAGLMMMAGGEVGVGGLMLGGGIAIIVGGLALGALFGSSLGYLGGAVTESIIKESKPA